MPDMPTIHTALAYVMTAWLALNAGVIFGAWWATRRADADTISRRLRENKR